MKKLYKPSKVVIKSNPHELSSLVININQFIMRIEFNREPFDLGVKNPIMPLLERVRKLPQQDIHSLLNEGELFSANPYGSRALSVAIDNCPTIKEESNRRVDVEMLSAHDRNIQPEKYSDMVLQNIIPIPRDGDDLSLRDRRSSNILQGYIGMIRMVCEICKRPEVASMQIIRMGR